MIYPEQTPSRPLIMGVLNVTPDSFSDGGLYDSVPRAVQRAFEMQAQGADLLDIGGESTRPGSQRIGAAEETARVVPVIRQYLSEAQTRGIKPLPISVDTFHAHTARAAVEAGASIVNDVTGGGGDAEMAPLVAELGCLYVCQHMRGTPESMDRLTNYAALGGIVAGVQSELEKRTETLFNAGVSEKQLIWDVGLGFAKTTEQSWELLRSLDRFVAGAFPVLVGASRKRFLAGLGGQQPVAVEQRDYGTAAVSAYCAARGVWAVRVHNVAATFQTFSAFDLLGATSGVYLEERWRDNELLAAVPQRQRVGG